MSRALDSALRVAVGLVAAITIPATAGAFEALDGRLQAHGFFESQMRVLNADFSDEYDISQWYQVFNLELEMDLINDEPVSIIDYLSAYARIEVRYDCVYSRGCGMFRNVNAYGDRAKSLPDRLNGANLRTATGAIQVPQIGPVGDPTSVDGQRRADGLFDPPGNLDPVDLTRVSGFSTLAGSTGADGFEGNPSASDLCVVGNGSSDNPGFGQAYCDRLAGGDDGPDGLPNDDPFLGVFRNFSEFRFAQINRTGGAAGGMPTQVLGPWLPSNFITENAALADIANPFDNRSAEFLGNEILRSAIYNAGLRAAVDAEVIADPTVTEIADISAARLDALQAGVEMGPLATATGGGANPFRPIPRARNGRFGVQDTTARGHYLPSPALRSFIDSGENYGFRDFNLREEERAWNRGASQQDEKELKEAYLDIELFDSRLWIRAGKQSIVWGKTELFRTTDQFNPQDLGLASLPSLEESRINLWAFRAVYSFYEVGPFEDVRLEGAVNFDQFEPVDLGGCGEAYTVNAGCSITFGGFAHGQVGTGLAGIRRPDNPWDDVKGIEFGFRLEWRWDRFSFALIDFYGYDDFPTITRIGTFERNVDPKSGRPRVYATRGRCLDGTEGDCLQPGPQTFARTVPNPLLITDPTAPARIFNPDRDESIARLEDPRNALDSHHANQQIFAVICSTTVGFSSLDRTACAQTVFGSLSVPLAGFSLAQLIGGVLAGGAGANSGQAAVTGAPLPLAALSRDIDPSEVTGTFNPGFTALAGGRDLANPGGCLDPTWSRTFDALGAGIPCGGGGAGGFALITNAVDGLAGEALGQFLTPEQEALLGCGPFWGNNCDDSGIDLLNAEGSALVQSFGGFEGTAKGYRTDVGIQPGTVGFEGGPVCTFGNLRANDQRSVGAGRRGERGDRRLPGCRGPGDRGYDPTVDGRPGQVAASLDVATQLSPIQQAAVPANLLNPRGTFGHPFRQWATAEAAEARVASARLPQQQFQNEFAAVSWNFQALVVSQSSNFNASDPYRTGGSKCSFIQPQFCSTVNSVFAVIGIQRNDVRAGGTSNGLFGRRTFTWHSGGEVILTFEKRNVLGFSMDFAEDVTKTNWGIEATWIEGLNLSDANERDGISKVDQYNLTVSIDRPTFINFLNANRTFFITTQWFFRYIEGYKQGMGTNGPYQVLGILAVNTGYYQDRLLPGFTAVYDVQSSSGALLPSITYRYNEAFSVTFGAAMFWGHQEMNDMSINPAGPAGNRTPGRSTYQDSVENGLAAVRDRDELFLRLRYTF